MSKFGSGAVTDEVQVASSFGTILYYTDQY
jgi:hypothetical protein